MSRPGAVQRWGQGHRARRLTFRLEEIPGDPQLPFSSDAWVSLRPIIIANFTANAVFKLVT